MPLDLDPLLTPLRTDILPSLARPGNYTAAQLLALTTLADVGVDQDVSSDDAVQFLSVLADIFAYTGSHFITEAGTSRTLAAGDKGKTILCTNAAAVTITVPSGLALNFYCTVIQLGAGVVTYDDDSGATTLNTSGDLFTGGQFAAPLSISNYGTTDTYLAA